MRLWLGTFNFRHGAKACLGLLKEELTSAGLLGCAKTGSKFSAPQHACSRPTPSFAPSPVHKPWPPHCHQGASRGFASAAVLSSSRPAALARIRSSLLSLERTAALSAIRPATRSLHLGAAATSLMKREMQKFGGVPWLLAAPAVRRGVATAVASSSGGELVATPLVRGGPAAERAVAGWLYLCSAWVFSMVVLGGVTRLTRSGLSMTDWRFTGSLPPMSDAEWDAEFDKYKQSPEYKRVNRGMGMDDFKFIYYMEYAHRMWGRGLGLAFALPAAYFAARGYITAPLARRLGLLFAMGGAQGFVGWWMVKSGLEEPRTEFDVPRVSPYRLAAHLTSAFAIYSILVWTALSVATPVTAPALALAPAFARARGLVHPVAGLVALTALSGAFVAGNDAGRAFNTWPLMGDTWVPEGFLAQQPLLRNFFEDTATVQFDHRLLAYTTLAGVAGLWATIQRLPLPPNVRSISHAMLAMTGLQVTLGIFTVLHHVPVSLGATHQAGALTLFTILLFLMHSVRSRRFSPPAMAAARSPVTPNGPATVSTTFPKSPPPPLGETATPVLAASSARTQVPRATLPDMIGSKGPSSTPSPSEYEGMASLFYKK